MKAEIPKTYNSQEVEGRWYSLWESKGYFHADAKSDRPAFVMVMPPPNVTGQLHMGHMLNDTVQDVIARRKRMQGFNTLWLPGMDHAGIAIKNVVERELRKEGLSRHDLGRENSSSVSGNGKSSTAESFSNSFAGSEHRATGLAKGSRSTRACREPCVRSLS